MIEDVLHMTKDAPQMTTEDVAAVVAEGLDGDDAEGSPADDAEVWSWLSMHNHQTGLIESYMFYIY